MTGLPDIATLWIGRKLSWLEQLCLKSFVDAGHKITLYSYTPIDNVPPGVAVGDANDIYPSTPMLRHARTGSPAIHADMWRLHLLAKTDNIWVDTDMYCFRPFKFDSPYVFGWEKPGLVCNAVLGLPNNSKTLQGLLAFFEDEYAIAPWLMPEQRAELQKEKDAGSPVHMTEQNWGFTGPASVTHFLIETGEIRHAAQVDTFYPISFPNRNKMILSRHNEWVDRQITSLTYGVHFWALRMKPRLEEKENNSPRRGSFMDSLLKRHAIDPTAAPIDPKKSLTDDKLNDPAFQAMIGLQALKGGVSIDKLCRQYLVEKSFVKRCRAMIKDHDSTLLSTSSDALKYSKLVKPDNPLSDASVDIKHYQSAYCVPGERVDRKTTTFGIFDASGSLTENSEILTSSWVSRPPKKNREPHSVLQIFGPAMFAGSADKQFGFALLNSIGRLWALETLPPETTIVFAEKQIKQHIIYTCTTQILRSLGIKNPILVLRVETRFEELYVPKEIFGEVNNGRGTRKFYEWIDERWGCKKAVKKPRKIYITRSALGPMAGRYACENHLERLLVAEGYEVYAPEQHTLDHQIETFLSGEKLIFAEGSALHLFSLIRQPHQISAVIQRRTELPSVMADQMADRDGLATVAINAVVGIGYPPLRGHHFSRAELDFRVLRDELKKAKLISGDAWRGPTKKDIEASMRAELAPQDTLMSYEEHKSWIKAQRK